MKAFPGDPMWMANVRTVLSSHEPWPQNALLRFDDIQIRPARRYRALPGVSDSATYMCHNMVILTTWEYP